MNLIAGGGISGLSLAFHLKEQNKPFQLFEADSRTGGKIRTLDWQSNKIDFYDLINGLADIELYRQNNYQYRFDVGANTLLADWEVMNFVERIGLKDNIQYSTAAGKKRFIYRNDKFQGISPSPLDFFTGDFFDWKTKFRILKELFIANNSDPDESFAGFIRRRFGTEALDWIAIPIMYGIHAGDPEKLLVADAFPSLWRMEADYGSVLRGIFRSGNSERPKSISFWKGMQMLPDQLTSSLKDSIVMGTSLQRMEKTEMGWNCLLLSGEGEKWVECKSVILCMPAPDAAKILSRSGMRDMADKLASVRYNPMVVSHLIYPKIEMKSFSGFGGLVPPAAGLNGAGAIWSSNLFSNRFPQKKFVMTSFLGGALQTDVLNMSKEQTEDIIQAESIIMYGRPAEEIADITVWEKAIPQYDVARREAEMAVSQLEKSGIYFLSNWKGGIGIADCIRNAARLSGRLH